MRGKNLTSTWKRLLPSSRVPPEGNKKVGEPRLVTVHRPGVEVGVTLCGGNLRGVYIESLDEDSPARGPDGLIPGDLILEVLTCIHCILCCCQRLAALEILSVFRRELGILICFFFSSMQILFHTCCQSCSYSVPSALISFVFLCCHEVLLLSIMSLYLIDLLSLIPHW